MRVDRRVAVPREVLRARGDTSALEPPHKCSDMSRDERCVRAERADADHGVVRVRVHVRDRREVEIDSGVGELGAQRRRDALGQLDVVHHAERSVARVRASGACLETRHVAALLVDGDQHVVALRAEVVRERPQLLSALDVPGVEDDAAEPFGEPAAHPVGHDRALEARQDARVREALEWVTP